MRQVIAVVTILFLIVTQSYADMIDFGEDEISQRQQGARKVAVKKGGGVFPTFKGRSRSSR